MPWQFWVGPAIGLGGVIFAIYAYNKNRKPKRLQYTVTADENLVSSSRHSRWAELAVTFGGVPVTTPRIVAVQIKNNGAVELRPEDYAEVFSVSVPGATLVAGSVSLGDASSGNGDDLADASVDAVSVAAPAVLLNPGDYLDFRLLVDGSGRAPEVRGRAAGFQLAGTTPQRREVRALKRRMAVQVAGLAAVGVATAVFIAHLDRGGSVPPVIGKPVADAVRSLDRAGVDVRSVDRVRDPAPAGTVLSVSPGVGKHVRTDQAVALVVSDGP